MTIGLDISEICQEFFVASFGLRYSLLGQEPVLAALIENYVEHSTSFLPFATGFYYLFSFRLKSKENEYMGYYNEN